MENNSTKSVKQPTIQDRIAIFGPAIERGYIFTVTGRRAFLNGIVRRPIFEHVNVICNCDNGKRIEIALSMVKLEARRLEYISDEHLLKIAEIEGFKMPQKFTIYRDHNGRFSDINFHDSFLSLVRSGDNLLKLDSEIDRGQVSFHSIQQLIEWGYALPYKQWSVPQLVEFGIYKLIEA